MTRKNKQLFFFQNSREVLTTRRCNFLNDDKRTFSSFVQLIETVIYGDANNCSDPHFSGEGGTIYSTGFFLFSQFWPTDIFIVENCEWYQQKSRPV